MPQTVIPQLRMRHADTTLPFYVQGLGSWSTGNTASSPASAVRPTHRDGQTIFLTEAQR